MYLYFNLAIAENSKKIQKLAHFSVFLLTKVCISIHKKLSTIIMILIFLSLSRHHLFA